MTKKTARAKKKAREVRLSPTQMMHPDAPRESIAGQSGPAAGPQQLREEYGYVVGDIRRALALGAVVLAVVVAAVLAVS